MRIYLWDTILDRLLSKGVVMHDVDIRYLDRWLNAYSDCFPKFMLSRNYEAYFNWDLVRWEIKKLRS